MSSQGSNASNSSSTRRWPPGAAQRKREWRQSRPDADSTPESHLPVTNTVGDGVTGASSCDLNGPTPTRPRHETFRPATKSTPIEIRRRDLSTVVTLGNAKEPFDFQMYLKQDKEVIKNTLTELQIPSACWHLQSKNSLDDAVAGQLTKAISACSNGKDDFIVTSEVYMNWDEEYSAVLSFEVVFTLLSPLTVKELLAHTGLTAEQFELVESWKIDSPKHEATRELWRGTPRCKCVIEGLVKPVSRHDRLLHMKRQISDIFWDFDLCQTYCSATANANRSELQAVVRTNDIQGSERSVVRVVVLWGESRSGKTQFIQSLYGMDEERVFWQDDSDGWYEGYKSRVHKVLVYDEVLKIGGKRMPVDVMNRICNRGGIRVRVKYTSAVLTANVIFLISNYNPRDWFEDKRQFPTLEKRFHWVAHWTQAGGPKWEKGLALREEEKLTGNCETAEDIGGAAWPPPPPWLTAAEEVKVEETDSASLAAVADSQDPPGSMSALDSIEVLDQDGSD